MQFFKNLRMRRTMGRLVAGIKKVKLNWSLPTNSTCEEKIYKKDITDKKGRLTARKQIAEAVILKSSSTLKRLAIFN